MTQTEALKLALEALDQLTNVADTFSVSGVYLNEEVWAKKCLSDAYFAITTIEEALAQPEQPKVRTGDCLLVGVCASEGHKIQKAQPEQEPVAFICQGNVYMADDVDKYCTAKHIPLYTKEQL